MIRLHLIDGRYRVSARRRPRGWVESTRTEVTRRTYTRTDTTQEAWSNTTMEDAWVAVSFTGTVRGQPRTTLRAAVEEVISRRDFLVDAGLGDG